MPTTAVLVHESGPPLAATPHFCVSLARSIADVELCQRLRYCVFNEELGEGLESSQSDGLDRDEYDLICDHLMVYDACSKQLVGTYRLQTGYRAKGNHGYYGELLFDFAPFEQIRGEILELGRACVHKEFRSTPVLHMLWKGIARYSDRCGARYLIGCSSLTSQDQGEGLALYERLQERYLAPPELRTCPQPGFACTAVQPLPAAPNIPRLFRAYLDISGRVCGLPAIDRNFRTIDFLTIVDLARLPDRVRTRYF
jgi:putative hemolysin